MTRKLDYSYIWKDTQSQLASHREGIAAITGVFLFLPDWVAQLFSGELDLSGAVGPSAMIATLQEFFNQNWPILLPTGLLSMFGAAAIYVLLTRRDMATIGSALRQALILLPFYFLMQLVGGFATIFGLILLIIPGFYIAGRLTPLAAVTVAETQLGVSGIVSRTWKLTEGNGWSIFFLALVISLVASLTAMVIGMIVGLVCRVLAGPDGVPLIETGVNSALGAVISAILISLSVAIYRHLSADYSPSESRAKSV